MKTLTNLLIVFFILHLTLTADAQKNAIDLQVVQTFHLGTKVGLLRAIPVQLAENQTGFLFVWSADKDIDPWIEMFYPPTDRLKLALYTQDGRQIWQKEPEGSAINGIWFTPVYAFDLDGNGTDEIYYVNNTDSVHILSYNSLRLEALDAATGTQIGQWPWKRMVHGDNSWTFRNFIFGGYANGQPILITAQGTYGRMGLQAWDSGMKPRWEITIEENEPGARGSHMSPIVDIDNDGIDEIFWGERCISIDNGQQLFVADREVYNGHSDVIQPTLNRQTGRWSLFTCRESGDNGEISPRVVMFDDKGNRLWTDLDKGHMDMGWTAQTGKDSLPVLAFTISRGGKVAGPGGFLRTNVVEYAYHAWTGKRIRLSFNAYNTVPVDLDGDGYHEFACALGEQADRKVYALSGQVVADLGEYQYIAMASKILNLPGEQIMTYSPDGTVKIWADKNAKDRKEALTRYANPYYKAAQRLTANGYNMVNLGGL